MTSRYPISQEYASAMIKVKKNMVHAIKHGQFGFLAKNFTHDKAIEAINRSVRIEMGDEMTMSLGHGIAIIPEGAKLQSDVIFLEHDETEMDNYIKFKINHT